MKLKKTTLILLLALLFSASSLWAQHEAKSYAINMSIGFQTGSTTWDQGNLNSAASFEYFLTKNMALEVGVLASTVHRKVAKSDASARFSQVGGDLHYHYTFYAFDCSWLPANRKGYLYAIVGGMFVQEALTNPNEVPDYLIVNSSKNLFGGDLGLGVELNFSRELSVFGSVVPRWEFTYNDLVVVGNVGVKLYF